MGAQQRATPQALPGQGGEGAPVLWQYSWRAHRPVKAQRADAEGIQMQLMGREMGTDLSGM